MSATGISPAWVENSEFKFGDPWVFDPTSIHAIFTNCDIVFLGDVNPTITMGVTCDVLGENIDLFHTIGVLCSTTFLGDINPSVKMDDIFVVVGVSGP